MAYGFVYILTNCFMPALVKIGHTERSPHARAIELSNHTGVPEPFDVFAYVEVDDSQGAERACHEALASCRVESGREFFVIDALDAWALVQEQCGHRILARTETGFVAWHRKWRPRQGEVAAATPDAPVLHVVDGNRA